MSDEQEVLEQAGELVRAFAAGDLASYFSCFAADASFVFHSTDRVLRSRQEYEALWAEWVEVDGFRVLSCESAEQRVSCRGDSAVLTHRVRTVVRTSGGEEVLHERETIVFHRDAGGQWLAVHEHLSADPVTWGPEATEQ